jgi:hypothetical protein
MEGVKVWLRNFRHAHERLMMRFLRRRGWVVFYLEEGHRECRGGNCWLSQPSTRMCRMSLGAVKLKRGGFDSRASCT